MPAQFKNDAVLRLVVLLLREAHFRKQTLLAPQTQPQANVGAGNAPSDTPTVAQTTVSPSMKSLGFDLAIRESVQEPESVEEKEPEVQHSFGW
jgi:hypothetical protein